MPITIKCMIKGQKKVNRMHKYSKIDQSRFKIVTMEVKDMDWLMPYEEMLIKGKVKEVKSMITEAIETTARLCKEALLADRKEDLHWGQMQL